MTVTVTTFPVVYEGADSTGPFAIPFYFLRNEDIQAVLLDVDGITTTTLVLDVDYTVTGELDEDGGSLTLTVALATGEKLYLDRGGMVADQLTDWERNDPFPARSTEDAVDKLTMLIQGVLAALDRALLLFPTDPPEDGGRYNAKNNRITVMADAEEAQDAVTLQQLQDLIDAIIGSQNAIIPKKVLLTGDNTTTVFTLGTAADWNTTNALLYLVDVGGVPQRPNDDYTLGTSGSNRTITFAAAPPVTSTDHICVRMLGYARATVDTFSTIERVVTLTSASGVLTIDLSLGNMFELTLTENITSVVFTNGPAAAYGQGLNIAITQHASAAKTITGWPAGVLWFNGTYAVSTATSAIDEVGLSWYASTKILGKYAKAAA